MMLILLSRQTLGRFLVIIVLMNVVACEWFGERILECITDSGPEFHESTLPAAILNREYHAAINVSIRSANDQHYSFHFSHSGELPPGMTLIKDEANRTFIIQGTPTQLGSLVLRLKVDVDYRYSGSADATLCSDNAEGTYIIDVVAG